MKSGIIAAGAAMLFVAGIGTGLAAKSMLRTEAGMFHAQAPADAARTLLDVAQSQAENGSWERIAIGRVHYLSGHKAEGQSIFDQVLAGKEEASDVYRIGRVYAEAGDWDKAQPMFDRFLTMGDFDEKELAAIGAYTMLHGDRAAAEALFDRSLARDPKSTWATLAMASAYAGVRPQD